MEVEERKRAATDTVADATLGIPILDIKVLADAIESAVEKGVAEDETCAPVLAKGRLKLAQMCLQDAEERGDSNGLKHWIVKGRKDGVEKQELLRYKEALSENSEIIYRSLCHEELLEFAAGTDIPALAEAIEAAEDAEVEEEAIFAAKLRCAELKMDEAFRSGKVDLLDEAIKAGEEAGLSAEVIAQAKVKRMELVLIGTLPGKNRNTLRQRLQEAEEMGVAEETLVLARRRLAELELAEGVRSKSTHPDVLRKLIEDAVDKGVDEETIAEARKVLFLKGASYELAEASKGDDPKRLQKAIEMAEEAGLDEKVITEATLRLAIIRLEKATAASNAEALRETIEAAEELQVSPASLRPARRELARLALEAAGLDQSELVRTIRNGFECDVDHDTMDTALSKVAKIDKAVQQECCAYGLEVLKKELDPEALEWALAAAAKAGVEDDEMAEANKRLVEVRIRVAADLERAVTWQFVALALKEAEAAWRPEEGAAEGWIEGLEEDLPEKFEAAKVRLVELERVRDEAQEKLKGVGDEIPELEASIQEAEAAGADAALLGDAKVRLMQLQEAARAAAELAEKQRQAAEASVSCSGSCSSVQPILLGSLHARDPVVLTLVPKLTCLLVAPTQATASRPDLILCWFPGGFRPCQTLAQVATDSRESLESFLPLEFSPASLSDLQVFVYHGSHCAGDGHAGVGVCLFLVVGSQVREVYRYQYFLGHMFTSLVAEFQGAYLALLIALSFLTWVAYHPRSASVP